MNNNIKRSIVLMLVLCMVTVMSACGSKNSGTDTAESSSIETNLSQIDMTKWQYNSDDDVYYQVGISYCENPADENYETLAVFVPGAYMTGTENEDGTYTCELNADAEVGGYTAATAPVVMPINTPGYSAQDALTEYTDVSEYTSAGFIYVHAGCRGRDEGAPAGVTDLKAAIRYIRYCDDVLAGDAESIFTFGMSGGGAQSAVIGSSGDSPLYDDYLTEIGAVQGVSDSVLGSMCWCPITNLDTADEAYEWMMGTTRSDLSDEEQQISDKLAEVFADYINEAGIRDEDGNVLKLEESDKGIYQSGTYYEYIKSVIEESLENFLEDTEFPYDASASSSGGGHMGGMGGRGKPSGKKPSGKMPSGQAPSGDSEKKSFGEMDDITRNDTLSPGLNLSGNYDTAQDYIDALNADGEWVTYDADTGEVTVTSVADFVSAFKTASKNLGAFDQLDGGQGENILFGYGDGEGAHFDSYLAEILTDLSNDYASEYASDLSKEDNVGNTADTRVDMYTPLYYLLESEDGYQTSSPAKFWRIRTGISQSDCALTTEVNLALALENYESVESVDFETVWGQGHTEAERTGTSTNNFIEWINECMDQ